MRRSLAAWKSFVWSRRLRLSPVVAVLALLTAFLAPPEEAAGQAGPPADHVRAGWTHARRRFIISAGERLFPLSWARSLDSVETRSPLS
jgi:hypothetical protein